MAKRITQSRVEKYLIATGILAPLGVGLFILLASLGAIQIVSYSGDMVCGENCEINITFIPNEDIFVYPMDASWISFDNPDAVKSVEMFRTWGSGLRAIDLNKTCTGSWCGCGWCTKSNTASFVYAFRENKTYTIVWKIEKEQNTTLKWSWEDGKVDPLLVGWEYVYANKTKEIQVLRNATQYHYEIYNESCKIEIQNKSGKFCKLNYTYDYIVTINKTYLDYKKRIGVKIGDKTVIDKQGINVYKDKTLVEFNIPVGDRNWEKYPLCRDYEKEKGVCFERKLDNVGLIIR